MIRIKKTDYDAVTAYAKRGLPHEVCGLVGGHTEGEMREIRQVYYLTNLDQSNEHFTMDPREQFAAVKDMREKGLEPLGNFHSHPETPARPSREDIRLAYDREASYLILSLEQEEIPVLKSFRIADGTVQEELLHIIE